VQIQEGEDTDAWSLKAKPAWTNVWHVWTVFMPRRTVTGKLACGRVWRRYNGRGWIYKRIVIENLDNCTPEMRAPA
jgi:hypothetical protein